MPDGELEEIAFLRMRPAAVGRAAPWMDKGSEGPAREVEVDMRDESLWLGPAPSLNASIGRIRCERILDEPFRPPGLSVASRIVASLSLSMRPALRRALAASAREPGAGEGLENIGVVDVNGARKDWTKERLDECRSCCSWAIEWLWSRCEIGRAHV